MLTKISPLWGFMFSNYNLSASIIIVISHRGLSFTIPKVKIMLVGVGMGFPLFLTMT